MTKPSPLDLPEILSHMASFVQLWKWNQNDTLIFKPRNLLSCALVSKFWRKVVLPHLWKVYSAEYMGKVPIDVVIKNSFHLRHISLSKRETYSRIPKFWRKHASGQLPLRCTALKSFSLTPESLPRQLELLRANSCLDSLDCWEVMFTEEPEIVTTLPCPKSLKELRLFEDCITAQELISLSEHFPSLERLQIGGPNKYIFPGSFDELAESSGVRIDTLKQLTIFEDKKYQDSLSASLSLFRHCPQLDHIIMNVFNPVKNIGSRRMSALDSLTSIHQSVLDWKSQQQKAKISMQAKELTALLKTAPPHTPSPQDSSQILEKLDIRLQAAQERITLCHAQFQHGCQDLVLLKAFVRQCEPQVIVPLLESFRHSLRQVDLVCEPHLSCHTPHDILSTVLFSLPELRRLKFETKNDFSKEESLAVFDWENQGCGSGMIPVSRTGSTTGWVCRHLEHLTIQGLWIAPFSEILGERQDVTLMAASKRHQWVAHDVTNYDEQFRAAVSERLRALSCLRDLTLNSTSFEYSKVHSFIE